MTIVVFGSFLGSIIAFRGRLIDDLLADGHYVHVVAPYSSHHEFLCQQLREKGVTLHYLNMRRNAVSPISDIAMFLRLINIFRSLQADILLAYNLKPVVYGLMAAGLSRIKIRVALITGLGFSFLDNGALRGRILNRFVSVMYRVAMFFSTAVVFQNDEDAQLFREKRFVRFKTKTFVVGGSGIDLDDFKVEPTPEPPVFFMASRFIKSKGVREYAEAAALCREKFPDSRFMLAGWIDDGPDAIDKAELAEWVESGAIEFIGELVDIKEGIRRASICVLPSYREGTSRFILEAMAMGRAIITSDAPGCKHTVEHGISGFMVKLGNSEALAEAMEKLIRDENLVESMAKESRSLAEERFDVRKVNAEMRAAMEIPPRVIA